MNALLRRLVRLERRLLSRLAPPGPPGTPEQAATVCERCGMLVETACWHRHCPLTGSRPR